MTRSLRFSTSLVACIWAMAQFPCAAHAAWPHDPSVGVQIAPTSFSQIFPYAVVPDGASGAIIAWVDHRNGTDDIYAQHVTATGAVAAGWPASGLAVCSAAGDQGGVRGVSDGAGGAFITWDDGRGGANHAIYAMRVNGNGTLASGWPANGQLLLSDPHAQVGAVIINDGAGSAVVVWDYFFSASDIDLYGARISATGVVVWAHSLVAPGAVQVNPAILPDGGGGFFLAYEDNFSGNWDLRAWRFAPNGAPVWGPTDVCALTGDQSNAACAPDGAGGLFVAWQDHRGADDDIYVERLSGAGATYPGWSPYGNAVCQTAGDQVAARALSDGAGGVILSWTDHRSGGTAVYAQRMVPGGYPSPAWPTNGMAVAPVPGFQYLSDAVTDGAGGAIVVWQDTRNDPTYGDLYVSRLTGSGVVAPGWSYAGTPLALAGSQQSQCFLAVDVRGGAIAAWQDNRNPGPSQIYAESIDRFGQLGDARPTLASVKDVKADQGGHVRLAWNASYLDVSPALPISSYWIWRQTPAGAAAAAVSGGGGWLDAPGSAAKLVTAPDEAAPGRRWFRHADDATADFAWEFVGSQPANGFAQYSFVAPTASDSVPGFNPYTVFMVEARGGTAGTSWDSPPDSGYSVDNLPPLAPAPVALTYSGGVAQLHWGRNLESDLANYRVYRGTSAAFVPGPSSLIGSPPDTGFADASAPVFYYKLSAVDAHGNESAFALLSPSGTTDAPDEPTALRLSRPVPNPTAGAARIAFALAHESHVRLVVHDVAGRTVRVLADGVLPAGEYERTWDRRDATGAAAHAGLYFVRMEVEGRRFNERLVVTGE
jgi:hypothetical protein